MIIIISHFPILEAEKRIQGITIKQAASTSATVDEISKVAKNLKLEPVAATPSPRMHRAGSTQSLDGQYSQSTNIKLHSAHQGGHCGVLYIINNEVTVNFW